MAARWPALLGAGFVLAFLTLLWFRFNAPPGEIGLLFPFDFIFYYYPMLQQAGGRMSAGDLPLWNPWQCCGVPFMATAQVGVYYPGNWLTMILPTGTAIVTSIFLHCLLGGWFAALFFRSLGPGWWASALGGGLFIFACMLGQSFWPSEVSTLAWMPFLFWAAERFCQSGRRRWWLALSAGTALQALAGFPQFVVYTWYLLGPFILVRLWHWRSEQGLTRRQAGRRLATIGVGSLLAMGLAAAQLLPTVELARHTRRGNSLTAEDVHYLEHERNLHLDWRGLIGNMFNAGPKLITFDFPDGTGHLGVMTPFMIALGLITAWRRSQVRLFAVAAAITFVLALGYSDVSRWLYQLYACLPTGTMFRTPSRLLLLCYFSLIALAVYGFDSLARGLPELRQSRYATFLALLTACCLVMLTGLNDTRRGPWLALCAVVLAALAVPADRRWWSRTALLVIVAAFMSGTLALATQKSGSLRDLPISWVTTHHYRGQTVGSPAEVTAAAEAAGLGRVALPTLLPAKVAQPATPFYSITDYEPLLPQRWPMISDAMDGTPVEIMSLADPDKYPAFYDLAGVTHLFVTTMPAEVKRALDRHEWQFCKLNPPPPVEEVRWDARRRYTALPRAYLVGHYQVVTAEEAKKMVVAGGFDWHGSVLLEEDPGFPTAPKPEPALAADIISYAPEQVIVRCTAAKESLLVLSDTCFPGWTASRAGKRLPILRANFLFRAVRVPPGTSDIVFNYHPATVRNGQVLSILSLLGFGCLAIGPSLSRRRARANRRPPTPRC